MSEINQEKIAKWYTDGKSTIKVNPGEEIPAGFSPGRTFNSNPWNKGLTAKTDERVRQNGEHTKETRQKDNSYTPWNAGLTKDTDARLQTVSDKVKLARQNKHWASTLGKIKSQEEKDKQSAAMQGKEPWNKGLSKETDERVKQTADKLIGHPCFVTDWEKQKEKEYLTKKLRNSFNTSKPEKQLYANLIAQYGEDNVIQQYRDIRYANSNTHRPYNCDFYVKSLDLFIELNYHWTHGKHPFNEDDKQDFETLCKLQIASTNSPEKTSYLYAIKIWTEVDPQKLAVLREHNLNFMILYPDGLVIDR